jgi:hypothetical protein
LVRETAMLRLWENSTVRVAVWVVGLLAFGMVIKYVGGLLMDAYGIPAYAVLAACVLTPAMLFCMRIDKEMMASMQKKLDKRLQSDYIRY